MKRMMKIMRGAYLLDKMRKLTMMLTWMIFKKKTLHLFLVYLIHTMRCIVTSLRRSIS